LALCAKNIKLNTDRSFLRYSSSTFFEFSSSLLSEYGRKDTSLSFGKSKFGNHGTKIKLTKQYTVQNAEIIFSEVMV